MEAATHRKSMQKANIFDRYAASYKAVLNRSISISGESGQYFADLKARYVASRLGAGFSGRLLDFGCGVGVLSRSLLHYLPGAAVDGYDTSTASISAVDDELAVRGRFTSVPEDLRADYDAIVVANVLHHVQPPLRQQTLVFLAERLSRKGCVFVFEHNPGNPLTRLAVYRCPFDEDAILLWPREARNLSLGAGLRAVRRDFLVFFPRPLARARFLEQRLTWCPLGAQYVLIAAKE